MNAGPKKETKMRGSSLGEKFLNWFSSDDPPQPTPPVKRVAVERTALIEAERARILERRLKDLLAQPKLLAAGRVHMINLDTLRDRLGDAWPELRDRVHAAAERIIHRCLSDRDIQFQIGDGEYIVVFAELNKQAATLVCAKIAEELYRLFLGDPDLKEVTVATAVGTLDGNVQYEHVSVAELLLTIGQASRKPDTADSQDEPGTPLDNAPSAPAAGPRKLQLASQEFDQINTMFRPIWDVGRQVISTYMCTPVRQFPDGSSVEGGAALASITDAQRLAKINADTLIDTVEILDELFRNKFRLMVSVPVCFETLAARRTRQDYISLCQSIPDYLRPFVSFEFLRFPAGVPNGRMTELVNELRPFCRWTFLWVDLKQPTFTHLVGTGLTGIIAHVPADRGAEARTMEDLNSFVAAAERANLRSCVIGITSTSLAVAARAAGVTFIAGDRIGRAEEIPQHMLRFGWQDLFLREHRR